MKIDLQVPNAGEWPPRSLSSLPRPRCSASPLSLRRGLWPHRGVCALPQRPSLCPWAPTRCRWRMAPLAAPSTWKTTRRGGGWSDAAPSAPRLASWTHFGMCDWCHECVRASEGVWVWHPEEIRLNVDPTDCLSKRKEAQVDDFPEKKRTSPGRTSHSFFFVVVLHNHTHLLSRAFYAVNLFHSHVRFYKVLLFCFFSPERTRRQGLLSWTEDAILEDLDCQNVFIWLDYKYSGADQNVHTTTNFYCKQSITSSDHCSPFASSWILKCIFCFFFFFKKQCKVCKWSSSPTPTWCWLSVAVVKRWIAGRLIIRHFLSPWNYPI